jgi:DNA-binding FrmR family transcriptional regulator
LAGIIVAAIAAPAEALSQGDEHTPCEHGVSQTLTSEAVLEAMHKAEARCLAERARWMPDLRLPRFGHLPRTCGSRPHATKNKQKLLARVRRLRGQIEAVERALEAEAACDQVMHLIAGARGAMAGLMAEVVEDHVRTHLVDAERHPDALDREAAEQLLEIIRTYLK